MNQKTLLKLLDRLISCMPREADVDYKRWLEAWDLYRKLRVDMEKKSNQKPHLSADSLLRPLKRRAK